MDGLRSPRRRLAAACLLCAVLAACAGRVPQPSGPAETVGPAAVWQGGMQRLRAAVEKQCPEPGPAGLAPCLHRVMARLGASPSAVRFSRSLNQAGCLLAFQEAGPVDAAWVHYPFRANELNGCILVNGTPARLDVDDRAFWPLASLKRDARYRALRAAFPDLSVWPGDRAGPGRLVRKPLPEKGRRFVAGYELRNGCHACEIVGSVDFAFDFDGDGTFLGSRVASMGTMLHVVASRTVTLSVEAPSDPQESWRAVRLPPSHTLRLKSKIRKPDRGEGQGGIEAWTFLALRPGRVALDLRRVPSGPGDPFPTARASFLVVIHEDEAAQESALAEVFAPIIDRRLEEMGSPRAGKVVRRIRGVHGDLARVDIHSRTPASDAWAMVYLKRRQGAWEVLAMGRSFEAAFYRSQGIPYDLRGPVEPEAPFVPLPLDACEDLGDALSEALGLKGDLLETVPFLDPSGPSRGEGCRITLAGTGDRLPGLSETADAVRAVLEKRGWTEDPACAADGPLGTAGGFRKDRALVLYRVVVEPAPGAGLLSNEPVSMVELLPEERLYTIAVEGARRP